jgi:hypothetical protein
MAHTAGPCGNCDALPVKVKLLLTLTYGHTERMPYSLQLQIILQQIRLLSKGSVQDGFYYTLTLL